ncbi:cGMP-dependent protein kinase 1 [Channa argus]|uniref:cGMP-dependent protein kinase 1 n=1 Tax=Channa argus TaxID=215402 RepID=A0A6G1QNR1_CHAAH|nr:cGMP-dependent protein kinase 1 [Channa argus]
MSALEADVVRLLRLKDERIGLMERRLREKEEEAAELRRRLHKCQSVLRGHGLCTLDCWPDSRRTRRAAGVSAEPVEEMELRRFFKTHRKVPLKTLIRSDHELGDE